MRQHDKLLTADEITAQVKEVLFSRYKSQLPKLAKGNTLKDFAISTFDSEVKRIEKEIKQAQEVCELYQSVAETVAKQAIDDYEVGVNAASFIDDLQQEAEAL